MKKGKKLSVLAAVALGACVCATAVGCSPKEEGGHTHEYLSWEITTVPTETAGGVLTGTCATDGATTTIDVPAFGDTDFWKATPTAPTHVAPGYITYSSTLYNVSVKIDGAAATGHSWGEWAFKDGVPKPTKTAGGTIVRICTANDGGGEEKAVPALTDTSFWTAGDATDPGHATVGTQTFTNTEYKLSVTVETPATGHDWSDWAFKDGVPEPSKTAGGTIVRKCSDDDVAAEEKPVPALTDASFWTAGDATNATHTTAGTQTFTNAEYKLSVTVETPALGHTWSAWAFVENFEPTETTGGKITRTCSASDGGAETVDVPALSDAAYWNRRDVAADYNTAGYSVYTPKDTSIVLEKRISSSVPKLVAPYDGKTYYALDFNIGSSENLNKTIYIGSSWNKAALALGTGDNDVNVGVGNAYPYQNKLAKIEMVDAETGKVKITMKSTSDDSAAEEYVGYVNMAADGLPVIVYRAGSYYFVLTTATGSEEVKTGVDEDHPDGTGTRTDYFGYHEGTVASGWTFRAEGGVCKALAVNYKYGEEATDVLNIYLEEAATGDFTVHFGASFKKKDNSIVPASHVFASSDAVYITDAAGDQVASFGYKNAAMHALDGYENSYTGTIKTYEGDSGTYDPDSPITIADATAVIDGMGGIEVSYTVTFTDEGGEEQTLDITDVGHYVALSDGKLGVYIGGSYDDETGAYEGGGEYFETTSFTETTFACELILIKVTGHNIPGEDGEIVAEQDIYVCKNIAVPFGGSDLASGLVGVYLDENFTQLLPEVLVPTEDVHVYYRWSEDFIEFVADADDPETGTYKVYYSDGMSVKDLLPEDIQTVTDTHHIVGWFTAAVGGEQVSETDIVTSGDKGTKLFAHWAENPAYAGEYEGKQLLASNTNYPASVSISVFGEIEGTLFTGMSNEKSIVGTVQSFDNGVITYKTASGAVGYIWFDDGVIVIPNDLSNNSIDTYPFVLSTNKEVTANQSLGVNQNKTYLIQLENSLALIDNDKVYSDVEAETAFGVALNTDLTAVLDSKTIVFKKDGEKVLAVGTTAEKYSDTKDALDKSAEKKMLDEIYGSYTNNGTTIDIDGTGALDYSAWEDKQIDGKPVYCDYVVESETSVGVYVYVVDVTEQSSGGSGGYGDEDYGYGDDDEIVTVKSKSNKEYWRITGLDVANGTFESIEKVVATLTYGANKPSDAAGMDDITDTSVSDVNIKIPYALSAVLFTPDADDSYIFDGWYADAECTGDALTDIALDGNKTIYAKWIAKRTITVHINWSGETDPDPVYIGDGKVAKIDTPVIDGINFIGWFTDADCTVAWKASEPVTADIELYGKWGTPAYMRQYVFAFQNTTSTGYKNSIDRDGKVSFNAQGDSTNSGWPFNSDSHGLTGYNETAGTFTFISRSGNDAILRGDHDGFIDVSTGLAAIGKELIGNDITDVYVLIPVSSKSDISNFAESRWNGGSSRAFTFTYGGNAHSVFLHKNKVYFDVTFKTAAGDDVAGSACYNSPTLYVRDSDGALIAKFGYDGTAMNELDGYEGITYTGAYGDITVDGVKNVNFGDKSGTYSIAADGSDYTADAYIDGEYYEITFDKDGATYTAVKRMVTLNYDTDYDATHVVSGEVNKNIGITLPVLTDDAHVFRGWFADSACTEAVELTDGKYIPTAASATLYAKWDEKVTLTVIYNTVTHEGITTMPNGGKTYGAGDELVLDDYIPPFTNGKVFEGWYTDSSCTTAFTDTTITANTTVYAKWIDAVAMYGTYYGWNLYGTSSGTKNSGFSTTYTVDPDGTVKKGSSVIGEVSDAEGKKYDPATGIFYVEESSKTTYFVYVDGVLCTGNTRATEDFDSFDLDLMFNKSVSKVDYSALLGEKTASDLTSGWLLTVTFADNTTKNIFATNTRIYSGVTWTATDSSGQTSDYTASNIGTASSLIIYDNSGNVIAKRKKHEYKWKEVDAFEGDYTGSLGKLTINGVGGVNLEGVSSAGTYKILTDGAYTADVYVDGKYYQVTLDKTAKTYTAVKPEAQVTFVSAHSTHAAATANLNVDYTLPTVENVEVGDFKFKGWYDNEDCTGTAITTIKPTTTAPVTVYARWIEKVDIVYNMNGHGSADNARAFPEERFDLPSASTISEAGWVFKGWFEKPDFSDYAKSYITPVAGTAVQVYAKWVKEVTLTVVYATQTGNADITAKPNEVKKYGAGDYVSLSKPSLTGGMAFDYWYTIVDEQEIPYSESKINDDLTVYCKWKTAHVLTGSYKGFNYCSSGSNKEFTSFGSTANVTADGSYTGRGSGKIAKDSNGVYSYDSGKKYLAVDESEGIIAEAWSTNASGLGTDFNIYFSKSLKSVKASANLTSSGWTGCLTVTYSDNTTVNVLIYNNKIYSGVTWNDGVDALGTKNAESLVIKDKDGNTIVTIADKTATAGSAA